MTVFFFFFLCFASKTFEKRKLRKRLWAVLLEVRGDHSHAARPHLPHLLDGKWGKIDILSAHLAHSFSFWHSWMRNGGIFTSHLLWSCSAANSRCSGGTWDYFIAVHYMEQTGDSIPTRHCVSYGCRKHFLAYLTPGSSEMSGFSFFPLGPKRNTKPLSPFT